MSVDLLLKPSCSGCGSTTNLYGSDCKHMTLCSSCGRTMAENGATCYDCGTTITRLIREYNVRASSSNDKNYFIARFVSGLPNFSKKKNAENRWSAHKEGLQGRQVTDTLREKYKNKPWLLEDETGQSQYHGHLEGSQSATYYLLMSQGKDFIAIPAGSWYNFNKVAQYKQLTLEEAEEKMKNRKKTADGYERWMMKAATTGPAAFGEVVKLDDKESGGGGGRGRKKAGDDDEGNASDRGDEDEEDGSSRKSKLRGGDDDDDEAPRGKDPDMDDEEEEKGDDWEHDERFSDDDERVDVDEEREDLANEAVPPEIKDDEDEEDEGNEEGGGLSQSGKELKKLLGKASGLNESEGEDDDDDDDMDDDVAGSGMPPLLVPKQKDVPKEEPVEDTPTKAVATAGSSKGVSPASKTSKGKRKLNSDDAKPSSNAPSTKKVKNDPEAKSSAKDGPLRGGGASKSAPSSTSDSRAAATSAAATGPVTEEEIKSLLMQKTPITTQVLVGKFKDRLRSKEDKAVFADILRKISKIQKTNGSNFVVLR